VAQIYVDKIYGNGHQWAKGLPKSQLYFMTKMQKCI